MRKPFVQYLVAGLLTLPGVAFAAGTVQLPTTNQTACFDANGNPRACAGTGEDGEMRAGVAWPASRFTVNSNGTVTDGLTSLTWSRHANAPSRALPNAPLNACPNAETKMIWLDALDFIKCLNAKNHAGFNDWRLPNLNELESMVNADVADTSAWLNDNGFGFGAGLPKTQVQPSQYWTSTSDASDVDVPVISAASAWNMDLVKGDFPFSDLKNGVTRGVWPVRGVSTTPVQLWRTGQTVCYDDIGDSRLCAGTGEDGENQAGAPWPAPRFQPNTGATFALDRVSGLIWTTDTHTPGSRNCPDTGLDITWQQALGHVACLNAHAFLGRSDWRLPTRKELHSLADYSRGAPALPAGHPFNDQAGLTYWSATTNTSAPKEAWAASMFDGSLSSAAKAAILPAWPVSGPDLIPPTLTITQGNITTKAATQTVSGAVEPAATVKVSINNDTPAAASVTGGNWSFTAGPLASGANAITVTADDFSENRSTASIIVTIDTAAPALAINPATTPRNTNKKNHTITGTMEAGSTVVVKMGTTTLPVTVDGGTWSCPVSGLASGANGITVTATDSVGNVASQTAVLFFAAPDGMIAGGNAVTIDDALKALRIAVGLVKPSTEDMLRGDVAPQGAPDDKIDVSDVVLILKKSVGLTSGW